MKDIVINGVSLTELKALQDKVAPGAMKFIAEHLEEGKTLLNKMRKAVNKTAESATEEERGQLEEMAKETLAHFQAATLVAGITGLQYDFYDYSIWFLEDADIDPENGVFGELGDLMDEMQRNTQYWNASIC